MFFLELLFKLKELVGSVRSIYVSFSLSSLMFDESGGLWTYGSFYLGIPVYDLLCAGTQRGVTLLLRQGMYENHPDRGGDVAVFKEIGKISDILMKGPTEQRLMSVMGFVVPTWRGGDDFCDHVKELAIFGERYNAFVAYYNRSVYKATPLAEMEQFQEQIGNVLQCSLHALVTHNWQSVVPQDHWSTLYNTVSTRDFTDLSAIAKTSASPFKLSTRDSLQYNTWRIAFVKATSVLNNI
jgi:hypothetical protein